MRVLFITNRLPTEENPGSSPAVEQQLRALRQLGHDIDLLFLRTERSKLEYLRGMWRVFWLCQVRGLYDVVHAQIGYCGIVARMQLHCPVVVTFRGSDVMYSRHRPISKLAAHFADASIVMTDEMKTILGTEASVIPYGVDLDTFKPRDQSSARRELGLAADAPIVLFPYDPARTVKRFDLVQAAVTRLMVDFPDVQLLALHDKTPEQVSTYMNAADVMVMASDREGSPSAIREAMGCNLPIVSVDVGDVASVIGGVDGCYLAERSGEDIANKLALVLRKRSRTSGREAVLGLSTSQAAREITAIYERLHPHPPRRLVTSVGGTVRDGRRV